MNQKLYEDLCEILGADQVFANESMKEHVTFRCGGCAEILVTPSMDNMSALISYLTKEQATWQVIGNGSNLLVGDGGIDGVVIEIGKNMSSITIEGTTVKAEAGAMLVKTASMAAEQSLTGLEFASGIPGSVGGAVVMNAGAYGGEMKDVLVDATVMDLEGNIMTLTAEELDLSYRHSVIPEKGYVVLAATMSLEHGDSQAIWDTMNDLKEKRVSKQPLEYPSAGSTFKRPEGYFAGKLIEDAGLRGYSVGDAQVSEKHCGFVVNKGNATSTQVYQLMQDVQAIVMEKFGVQLEPEVRMIGKF